MRTPQNTPFRPLDNNAGIRYNGIINRVIQKHMANKTSVSTRAFSKKTKNLMLVRMMDYEDGTLSNTETLTLFQYLIDTGLAWKLQGHYKRMANALIEKGLISAQTK